MSPSSSLALVPGVSNDAAAGVLGGPAAACAETKLRAALPITTSSAAAEAGFCAGLPISACPEGGHFTAVPAPDPAMVARGETKFGTPAACAAVCDASCR